MSDRVHVSGEAAITKRDDIVRVEVSSGGALHVEQTSLLGSNGYINRLRDVDQLFEMAKDGQVRNVEPAVTNDETGT